MTEQTSSGADDPKPIWTQATEGVKQRLVMPTLWRAMERGTPVLIHDNELVIGYPVEQSTDSHLVQDTRYKNVIEQCIASGSAEDLVCGRSRGLYPVGAPLPFGVNLTQVGDRVSGMFALGAATGPVTGVVTNGVLSLQGTGTSGPVRVTITSWNTRVNGNAMEGNVTYAVTVIGA